MQLLCIFSKISQMFNNVTEGSTLGSLGEVCEIEVTGDNSLVQPSFPISEEINDIRMMESR